MTLITGNTYPVKAQLSKLGKWNAAARGWEVPDDKAEEARAIVASAPPHIGSSSRYRQRKRYRAHTGYTRFSSGAEMYRNPRGRCEDAPCCGCCT